MKIVFRVDSSVQIGTGHVMRCMTLADALRKKGADISFVSRELTGNICDVVENNGYRLFRLPYAEENLSRLDQNDIYAVSLAEDKQTDAEQTCRILLGERGVGWLIVDHYALDASWEKLIRPFAGNIMVIDDLANRAHDCDLLLDQNLHEDMAFRYDGLVPKYCRTLLGPRYALLRPEFLEARKNLRERNGRVRRFLVFFGGSDQSNETTKALEAWIRVNRPDIAVDVIVGAANPHSENVQRLCTELGNVTFHCNVNNMAQMMTQTDLAIGAGGSTTWERCFLGLPSITLILAENQAESTIIVAKRGATWNLGWYEDVNVPAIAAAIRLAVNDPHKLQDMSRKAQELIGEKVLGEDAILSVLTKAVW